MKRKALFVDDEKNVLSAIRRQLRKKIDLEIATSGTEALEILAKSDDYSAIVADMRMPEMNGIELLEIVKEKHPEIVRLMLTGNADFETALNAVNVGNIFRFLVKPIKSEELIISVEAAFEQFELKQNFIDLERKNAILAMAVTTNHEINQPLTVLQGNFELLIYSLKNSDLSPKQQRYIQTIKTSLEKIQAILVKYKQFQNFTIKDYIKNTKMVVFEDSGEK